MAIVLGNGERLDLGSPITWIVRPSWEAADMILIVQTKDGVAIGGIEVPKLNIPLAN